MKFMCQRVSLVNALSTVFCVLFIYYFFRIVHLCTVGGTEGIAPSWIEFEALIEICLLDQALNKFV